MKARTEKNFRFAILATVTFVSATFASPALAEEGVGGALQGVAKIIEAASPIGEAAARAQADKQIAQINADASIAITQIGANTSLYLADVQASVALYQSMTAALINKYNQDGVTDRLVLQLNELRAARQEAYAAEREKMELQKQFQMAQIQLAYKQAADSLTLAREQMKLQLTQAGLSQGFSNSRNSGSGLTITRLGLSGSNPATSTVTTNGGFQTASTVRGATDENASEANAQNSNLVAANVVAKPQPVKKQAQILVGGRGRSATSNRLLASVNGPRVTYTSAPKVPAQVTVAANAPSFATANTRGSTAGIRLRLGQQDNVVARNESPSDLRGFMQAFRPTDADSEPSRHRGASRGIASTPPADHGGGAAGSAVGNGVTSVTGGHRSQ